MKKIILLPILATILIGCGSGGSGGSGGNESDDELPPISDCHSATIYSVKNIYTEYSNGELVSWGDKYDISQNDCNEVDEIDTINNIVNSVRVDKLGKNQWRYSVDSFYQAAVGSILENQLTHLIHFDLEEDNPECASLIYKFHDQEMHEICYVIIDKNILNTSIKKWSKTYNPDDNKYQYISKMIEGFVVDSIDVMSSHVDLYEPDYIWD